MILQWYLILDICDTGNVEYKRIMNIIHRNEW